MREKSEAESFAAKTETPDWWLLIADQATLISLELLNTHYKVQIAIFQGWFVIFPLHSGN